MTSPWEMELASLLADPEDRRHGTTYAYRLGCRCDSCLSAAMERVRAAAEYSRASAAEIAQREEIGL